MIIPNEKTYRGKFRYENHNTKHGRISISSKVTKLPDFPFKNSSTVVITLRNDYLIIEPLRIDRIEPIRKSFQCDALDCNNNIDGVCITEHKIDIKGCCKSHEFNRNWFNKTLNEKVKGELIEYESRKKDEKNVR